MSFRNLVNLILAAVGLMILSGCGRSESYQFESRELTPDEIQAYGYEPEGNFAMGGGGASPAGSLVSTGTAGALINALAGTVQKLLSPGESQLNATIIGQALPPGVSAFQLNGAKSGEHVYEKKLSSVLGFNVVRVHYKIGFQYGAKNRGKGAYITNVKFIPLSVSTDALWSLKATAISEEPTNSGTRGDPVAKLGFAVTFTAHGPGTRAVTDEFELEGKSGELKASLREFEN